MKSAAQSDPISPPAAPGAAAIADDATRAALARGEALSAWLDGELDAPAGERQVGTLLQDDEQRQRYAAWCLVGDALRSHEVAAGHSPRLCSRIAAALHDEPALLAPRALPARRLLPAPMARHVASGAAIAAAAAVVVMVALPQLRAGLGGTTDRPADLQAAAGAPSVPVALSAPGAAKGGARDPRLDPYLQAHRDFSGGGVMPAAAVYLRFGSEGER
jgi:sigma-E factor negative regulatory protein RseA